MIFNPAPLIAAMTCAANTANMIQRNQEQLKKQEEKDNEQNNSGKR